MVRFKAAVATVGGGAHWSSSFLRSHKETKHSHAKCIFQKRGLASNRFLDIDKYTESTQMKWMETKTELTPPLTTKQTYKLCVYLYSLCIRTEETACF